MRRQRLRRIAATTALCSAATLTAAGASRPEPYAAPAAATTAAALASPGSLQARYDAVHADIVTARDMAVRLKDSGRVKALNAFLQPGRRFLAFDARGTGHVVEVHGDLARADRIAVVVPGADGELTNFDSWKWAGGGARALAQQAVHAAPNSRLAVIAWLGYDSPSTLSTDVLSDDTADHAATTLRGFLGDLHRVNGKARIALLGHSYGSVVLGRAIPHLTGLPVDEIALFGSPGVTRGSVTDLKTPAHVWAGRAAGDWMQYVPKIRFAGIGFGKDPISRAFGAQRFAAGSGTHSEYLKPGSASLRNLTLIALGLNSEVTHA
ncbi:hypothetical protein J4573_32755 [Actinomadura barringtoniae]|uniref:DUF1023 domain-containing protein n=1 Tax=Actinomadura barringtoniae TaxID=1427535 RepID=A0A939T9Y6_9ACTN|nr:alpha/beta hydrolase [Actinomadura barringtoniae]MBO2451897.1 hypothetical protein [Actinomadura barringtoniae]